MPIISFKDNRENNWKWNAKTKNKQTRKITRGTETIAKGWEINNFVEGLGYHVAADCRYLRIWDLLSFLICSSILVSKWRCFANIDLPFKRHVSRALL